MDFGFANAGMFSNPTFGVDTTGLSGPKNFLGGKSGGKSMVDPVSAGFTFAGMAAQGILGAIGANKQANALVQRVNSDNRKYVDSVVQGRDMAKGQIAMGMFGTLYNTTTAADLDFGRQLAAKRKEYSEFIPKGFGLDREQARWQTDFALSPAARELASRQRLGRVKESIAPDRAQKTGIFGRIAQAPIESFMV